MDIITRSGASVTFHILDEESYKQAKAQRVDLANPHRPPDKNRAEPCAPKAKLCYLVNSKSGYGFSLSSVSSELQTYPEASDVQITSNMLHNIYIFIIRIYNYEKSRLF